MRDWSASFVAPGPGASDRVVRIRHAFDLDAGHGEVVAARLAVTALGVVEAEVNGTPAADDVLTPGWTSYEWRLRVAEHDVTAMIAARTTLELRLGAGWYAGRLTWTGAREFYGDRPAAAAELVVDFADGHRQIVATGDGWEWAPSSTPSADLYDGQTIDARIGEPGQWAPVDTVASPAAELVPYGEPPVVRHEALRPQRVWRSPSGRLLVDFGQNLVGWPRLRVHGTRGTEITLRHAEVLEDDELGTRPLRSAAATDHFILSGGDDLFEPTFTFHGYRYAEVDGWPGTDDDLTSALEAVVIGTKLTRTGSFRSSNELLNRFHENVVWGLRGNFVDLPTDCPQRDERLGWTGDIAVFAPTAAFLYDVQDFLTEWMRNLAAETAHADGVVPYVVPDALKYVGAPGDLVYSSPDPTAIWGDAAVWVPSALFRHDGDLARLRELYPAMRGHGETVERTLSPSGLWDRGFQYGDWLDPLAPPDDPIAAMTPTALVATASGHRSFRLLSEAAAALGDAAGAARWTATADRVRDAFRAAYLVDGRLVPETVTAYTLAIVFGLVDEAELPALGDRLAALVTDNGHRISTGFAGTPYVCDALTVSGHPDEAYRLLLQTECPSWLYAVTMGATTVWERWDSMLPDGTINPGEMTSFNHYALGSVADWLHRTVGGIAPAEPGYGSILISPVPGGDLTWCESRLDLVAGTVAVRWEIVEGALVVDVETPVPATVRLPGRPDEHLAPGRHRVTA